MRVSSHKPSSLYREEVSLPRPAGKSFSQQLKEAFYGVNQLQKEADRAAEQAISGDMENLHQLLIATEKARLSMQLTVRVTNKLVEAYQELSRMQV